MKVFFNLNRYFSDPEAVNEEEDNMKYPMHPKLKIGNKFPDFELPDHTGTPRKLTQLLRGFPGVLTFIRGYY